MGGKWREGVGQVLSRSSDPSGTLVQTLAASTTSQNPLP